MKKIDPKRKLGKKFVKKMKLIRYVAKIQKQLSETCNDPNLTMSCSFMLPPSITFFPPFPWMNYAEIGRKILSVDALPQGALPRYDEKPYVVSVDPAAGDDKTVYGAMPIREDTDFIGTSKPKDNTRMFIKDREKLLIQEREITQYYRDLVKEIFRLCDPDKTRKNKLNPGW